MGEPGAALLVSVAAMAGAVAAVSGFGIGSLVTPVLMIGLPASEAVALVAVPHAVATAIRWIALRREVHGPTFRQFGLASATGALAGAWLHTQLASPRLGTVLAVLLIVAGTSELTGRRIPLPQTPFWRRIGGVASGLFGGLVGNQGGIRTAALLGAGLPPRQLVATATATALVVDAARVPFYVWSEGPVLVDGLRILLWLSAGVTLGTLAALPILARMPGAVYRRTIGALLLTLGLTLLMR